MASFPKCSDLIYLGSKVLTRHLSISTALSNKQWRVARGLPVMKNSEGILTDGPDYTFLDGRPTPLLNKQKLRMLKQQDFAKKIVELSSELDFAVERQKKIVKSKDEERQRVLGNRLKPKGYALLKKN